MNPNWISLERTTVEQGRGFATVMHRATDFRTGDSVIRKVIPIDERSQKFSSAFALLRQNLAQRVREWRDRKAERDRGTELKVQRIRDNWERKR